MKIRILGAHNIETNDAGCTSILIDDVLAIDAGALTAKLSFKEQGFLKAVLLTHQHYDHVRDILLLGMSFNLMEKSIEVYTTDQVYRVLTTQFFNGILYPDFTKYPPEKPALHFNMIEPGKTGQIIGYNVLPIKVKHSAPTVGYQITSPDGKKVFITSDTGPGLEDCWQQVSPNLLITETTVLNRDEDFALKAGHLTPALLQKELESFRKIKGYLPQIVLIHMSPILEKGMKAEISAVEKALKTKITLGHEGMKISI